MTEYHRHLQRGVVGVARVGAVALAPETVVTGAETLVAGVDDKRVTGQTQPVELRQQATHGPVHSGAGGKVLLERLALVMNACQT